MGAGCDNSVVGSSDWAGGGEGAVTVAGEDGAEFEVRLGKVLGVVTVCAGELRCRRYTMVKTPPIRARHSAPMSPMRMGISG
jgi:hypothetical protein